MLVACPMSCIHAKVADASVGGDGHGAAYVPWLYTERLLAECVLQLVEDLLSREWELGLMNDGGTMYYHWNCGKEEHLGHTPDCIYLALHETLSGKDANAPG